MKSPSRWVYTAAHSTPPFLLADEPTPLKTILRKTAKWLLILLVLSLLPVILFRWVPVPGSMLMAERWVETRSDDRQLDFQKRWLPYRQIPDNIKMAVIAAEDQRFAEHHGLDLKAIQAALQHNQRGGNLRGASTLSQQVAKNLFLWSDRSWLRKGLEVWFTLAIETLWPKQRILEVYLNIVEWDEGVFGVSAAAEHHFGVAAGVLSDQQAAQLAAVLPNPRRWSAASPTAHALQRSRWIRQQSRQLGGAHYLRQMEAGRDWPQWLTLTHWQQQLNK